MFVSPFEHQTVGKEIDANAHSAKPTVCVGYCMVVRSSGSRSTDSSALSGAQAAGSSGAPVAPPKADRKRSAAAKAARKKKRRANDKLHRAADKQSDTSVEEDDGPPCCIINVCKAWERLSVTYKVPRFCGFCGKPWYLVGRTTVNIKENGGSVAASSTSAAAVTGKDGN